jgi:pyruvate dehydrogenase complex dehydrogenase (E1) component
MRLPSKYLVQSVEYNSSKTSFQEVRFWAGEKAKIASRLESIRRMALAKISRVFAFVEEYGVWVAVTDAALEEARKVSQFVVDELKKLNLDHFAERYTVRAVPVYLEPGEARELLAAAVRHLSADAETLKQKIAEAEREQEKREIRRLRAELERVNALLSQFLSEMRRRGW